MFNYVRQHGWLGDSFCPIDEEVLDVICNAVDALEASGLPIGIQVVGPYGSDYRTIRLAARVSELCGGYQPPPMAES